MDLFARAALLDDTRPEPHLGLALCYANLGDESRAPRRFDACMEHGFGAGDFTEVVYEFDDAEGQTLVVEIGMERVLIWRAACHLALDPDERDAHFVRGRIHERHGDPHAAIKAYGRAIKLDPDEIDFRLGRAQARLATGDRGGAESDLQRAETLLARQLPQPARAARIEALRAQARRHRT